MFGCLRSDARASYFSGGVFGVYSVLSGIIRYYQVLSGTIRTHEPCNVVQIMLISK